MMPSANPTKKRLARKSSKSAKRINVENLKIPSRKTVVGSVFVCGQSDVGQLGLGVKIMEKSCPFPVPNLSDIVDICAGGMHSVCLTSKGKVITFGCNDEYALGRITKTEDKDEKLKTIPEGVELPEEAVQISAGDNHTAALLKDGRVFFWGTFKDTRGTIGLRPDVIKSLEPIELLLNIICTQIASGSDHLAVLTANGHVYTIGDAEFGQLGRLGKRMCDRHASRQGTKPLLTPRSVNLEVSRRRIFVDKIWAADCCTYAKSRDSGTIYVTGLNNYGQLGLQNTTKHIAFYPDEAFAFSQVKGKSWKEIAGGPHHTIATDNNGGCYALGRKENGRLGLDNVENDAQKLTRIPTLIKKKCVSISCGLTSSFAVTYDGFAYGWGANQYCQLGTGIQNDNLIPEIVENNSLGDKKIIQVSAGGEHTMFLAVSPKDFKQSNGSARGRTR